MEQKQRKLLTTLLKIGISATLLYFIFTKIDIDEVTTVLAKVQPFYFITALLLVFISKVFSAYRLNLFFYQIGVHLSQENNLKLYLQGMFYNLFLPGGIGGDAYKGYIIQKKFQVGTKKVVGALLLDRLSGLALIFVFAILLSLLLSHPALRQVKYALILLVPIALFIFWKLVQRFFPYAEGAFWPSLIYSALVQFTQLVAVICLLKSLSELVDTFAYLVVFLVSSIVSVIPLTIGGVGSREVTFLYGSKWLDLDPGTAIGVSFLFFLITAIISFIGIYYHFNKVQLNEAE